MNFETSTAYTTATAAASDGVKYPEKIPPRMISGIRMAGSAFRNVLRIFFILKDEPFGYFHLYACTREMAIRTAPIRIPGRKPALKRRLTLSSAITA